MRALETHQRRLVALRRWTAVRQRTAARSIFPVVMLVMTALSMLGSGGLPWAAERPLAKGQGCLVRIDVEKLPWHKIFIGDGFTRAGKLPKIYEVLHRHSFTRDPELPDFQYGVEIAERIHLLFLTKCGQRLEFTRKMLAAYRHEFPDGAKLSLSDGPADPSRIINTVLFFGGKAKFTRSQCAIMVDVIYREKGEAWGEEGMFFDFSKNYIKENYPRISFFAHHWIDKSHLYLQYWRSCDRKFAMTREMIEAYKRKHPGGPEFKPSHDVINPKELKVQHFGPYWIDG